MAKHACCTDDLASTVFSRTQFFMVRMRSCKLVMITGMVILSFVYLLTYYTGQGNAVSSVANTAASTLLADGAMTNQHTFTYVLNKPHLCGNGHLQNTINANNSNNSSSSNIRIGPIPSIHTIITVVTTPSNAVMRQAIRQTWGTIIQNKDYRIAFVMGLPEDPRIQKKVIQEDSIYGDIVQEDFVDTYRNLSLKSIAILKWVDSYCSNSKYLLKIDDDCFLNAANLRSYLDGRKEKRTIFGRVWQKVKPIRDEKDKWHVTKEEFAADVFPDYVGGPTYAITTDAVSDLYSASQRTSGPPFVLEDVYVTGICADRVKVSRVTDTKFGVADAPTTCSARTILTYHRVSPDVMFLLWWLINDSKLEAICTTTKSKDTSGQQCSKMANAVVDLTNLVIKNVHGL